MSAASAASALKAALVTASDALFGSSVIVAYGPTGIEDLVDIIEWLNVAVDEGPSLGSPQRRRHHEFTATGKITCGQGGTSEVQQTVTERALAMLDTLTDYLQDSGVSPSTNVTLSGVVDWARVASFEMTEEAEEIEVGRTTYVDFTVTGQITA